MASSSASSSFYFLCFVCCFLHCFSLSAGQQLSPSQTQALFRIQRSLEYPTALLGWNRYTSFCYLPKSSNFSISCSNNTIKELTIVGDKPHLPGGPRIILSSNFSIDSLFTTLSRFPAISNLSLVSLGIWGQLPPKVDRFGSLQTLNLSSNYIYGQLPQEISNLKTLKSLDLGGNLFKGSVPDLTELDVLEELDLGVNQFGPEFPLLGNNLVTLVLRNNSFRANIPMGIQSLTRLQVFDVYSNRLSGQIPSFLFSLPSIRYLGLGGNSFMGTLPVNLNCGKTLTFVDLSNNKLVGQPPSCLRSNSTNVTVMYSWNCLSSVDSSIQHPNSYCINNPLAVMPSAIKKNEGSGKSKSKLGLLLGIIGGVVGGAIVMVLVLLVVWRKTSTRDDESPIILSKSAPEKGSDQTPPKPATNGNLMSPEVRLGMLGLMPYRVFEMEELEEATNNFDSSNLIQESSQVQLYRGWIQDGSAVTIRCLKLKQKHSPQVLLQYMDAFSKFQHRHLVSILGHCIAEGNDNSNSTTVYLIFEHVSNGTLRSHLTEWRKREMLKWPQRITAAIGISRGIQFLHTVTVPGIIGNDLKIENILLDRTLTAKIHNYNLPMALRNKNNKAGQEFPFSTMEEKDISRMKHGDKEDVYQLGLILLEVITGKPPATESELEATKHQMQQILTDSSIDLQVLTDPAIHGTFAHESLRTVVEVTLNCLSKDISKRPSVDDILWNLQYSVQVQDGCATSDSFSM